MVARRTVLLGSSGLLVAAATGCTSPAAPPAADRGAGGPALSPTAAPGSPATTSPSSSTSADGGDASPSADPGPEVPENPEPVLDRTVAKGLEVPWGLVFLRSGDAVVGERESGRLLRVTPEGRTRTLGEVAGLAAAGAPGEGGLLGLALAPGDDDTLFAYLSTRSDNRVVRLSLAGGRVGRPRPVLAGIPTSANHHGGQLLLDRDGMLFVSTGDAQDGALAQRRSSLAGKILRVRLDGRAAPGNPFDSRVWSYGHRNVEGLALDAAGRLWATEFGEQSADELNLIRPGRNYGWPAVEGRAEDRRYTAPRATWSPTSTCSPAGLAVAGSTAFVGALQGRCLFGVPLSGSRAGRPRAYLKGDHGRIRTVALAPDGSLWITTSNTDGRATPGPGDDRILRLKLRSAGER